MLTPMKVIMRGDMPWLGLDTDEGGFTRYGFARLGRGFALDSQSCL